MPKNVQLPDGRVVAFPDTMSDDEVSSAIQKDLAANAPSTHPYLDAAKDFGKGVLKSGVGTMSALDDFAQKHLPAFMTTPIGQTPNAANSQAATDYAKNLATPTNTAQSIGKGIGNAAQFLIPGAAEEGAASAIAPMVGKLGSKIAASAIGSSLVNKAEGGSLGAGAAAGAGGAILGAGLKALAAPTAETALGVRAGDRAFNRTPGQAILDETTGTDPGDIAAQAGVKSRGYTDTLNDNALQSNIPVDLQPARNTAASFLGTAVKQNNGHAIKEVGEIGNQLAARPGIGPIPQLVPADEALALRRGIDDLQGSWNPNLMRSLSDAAVTGTRQELATGLERSIPGYRDLNSKISTLIPVAARAGAADLNAGILQRVIGKAARPTGALVGSIAGGTAGYKEGGVPGAIAGGITGLVAPEVLTSPKALMIGARGLDSNLLQGIMPAATGLGLQLKPKKSDASE